MWILLAIGLAALAPAYWAWHQNRLAEQLHQRALAEYDAAYALANGDAQTPATATADETQDNQAELARLRAIAAAAPWSQRLRGLAAASLPGVWLREIVLLPQGFHLQGQALAASLLPTYLQRLAQQPGFAHTPMSALDIDNDPESGRYRFVLKSQGQAHGG
ncbi:MAG: hypothetical protein RMK60_07215 [Burkholderiales bacterium]|nr:hypothetical protein [Burkholderiales bacterium]